jgi:hypothetical protein
MGVNKVKELTDRYVYDVARRLPQAQRDDIEKELRGLIDDMLQARTGDIPPTVDDVTAVLKELGQPQQLAGKYRGIKRYLIGPDYYDIYWLVLKIVLGVSGIGLVIALIVSNVATPPQNAISAVAKSFGGIISGLVQAFAYVTIAFALVERFNKKSPWDEIDWDPKDLPPVPPANQRDTMTIKRGDPIAGLIFGVIGLVIFNAIPWILGYVVASDELVSVPVFNLDVLRSMLLLINVLICLGMLKDVLRLIAGRYTLKVSLSIAAINIAMLVLNIVIFLPPAIWNADFLTSLYAATSIELFASQGAQAFWTVLPTVIVVLASIGYVSDTGVTLYRGIRGSTWRSEAL